jgi:hypothetical protein
MPCLMLFLFTLWVARPGYIPRLRGSGQNGCRRGNWLISTSATGLNGPAHYSTPSKSHCSAASASTHVSSPLSNLRIESTSTVHNSP